MKKATELGDWENPLVKQAQDAYESGDFESALLHYMVTSEMGFEVSQMNAAWMIDTGKIIY